LWRERGQRLPQGDTSSAPAHKTDKVSKKAKRDTPSADLPKTTVKTPGGGQGELGGPGGQKSPVGSSGGVLQCRKSGGQGRESTQGGWKRAQKNHPRPPLNLRLQAGLSGDSKPPEEDQAAVADLKGGKGVSITVHANQGRARARIKRRNWNEKGGQYRQGGRKKFGSSSCTSASQCLSASMVWEMKKSGRWGSSGLEVGKGERVSMLQNVRRDVGRSRRKNRVAAGKKGRLAARTEETGNGSRSN